MDSKYKIYKNGVLVAEQNNIVTTFGKAYILGAMANQFPTIGDSIAVGTSTTPATVNDVALGFEFSRGLVNVRSASTATSSIILKATLDDTVGGTINEVGFFPTFSNPASGEYGTKILSMFDPTVEQWSGGVTNTTSFKLGSSSLEYDIASGATAYTLNPFVENLEGYSTVDRFSLGYFINDANAAAVNLQFQTDYANYFQYTFNPGTAVGYNIQNWNKTAMTSVGSPDWSNITTLVASVGVGGSSVVELDGLIISDIDIYEDYGIISHAILTTPIIKAPDEIVDIEYYLNVSM